MRGRLTPVRPAPPRPDCRICGGSGEDAHGQRCVCTYNKDRAALATPGDRGRRSRERFEWIEALGDSNPPGMAEVIGLCVAAASSPHPTPTGESQ